MRRLDTSHPEVWELRAEIYSDARGSFFETYQGRQFAELGIFTPFVQDNHSISAKYTLRGLHYQLRHPQAKLCRVVEGEALDIAVDIRAGSPNFAKWTSVRLTADLHNEVFIPAGFAHGFLALTDRVQFLYKCSDFYDPSDEHGVVWNDPQLAIDWGISNPLLSEKDARFAPLSEIDRSLLPVYSPR